MIRINNQIELRHLSYFVTLADYLHYGKAAKELLISQSSLSQQISRLEHLLAAKLFERDNRNVSLTDAGIRFREEAVLVISQFNTAIERWKLLEDGFSGLLKIGFVGSAMADFLPQHIAHFTQKHKNIKLYLDELNNERQIKALTDGILDIGFVRSNKVPIGHDSVRVQKEPFCLLLPIQHPLVIKGFNDLSQVANEYFILFPNDSSQNFYNQIVRLCNAHGFSPKVSHRSIHGSAIHKLVELGLGISIVPKSLVDTSNKKVFSIELTHKDYFTELFAVWPKNHTNKALHLFLEQLSSLQ